jgi:RsiW-degrading membrane proteinase PrsW (M82 family)
MACNECDDNIWKQKLGRCKRCMLFNFVLLVGSAGLSFFMWQTDPKSVQTITVFVTLFFSSLLMLLHAIAFLYYRLIQD